MKISSTALKACSIVGVCLLAACAGEPALQQGDDAEVVMGTLNRVDNARFDFAYVDASVNYQGYQRVFIQPLDLDHVEIRQPNYNSATLSRRNQTWELTDDDREKLRDSYREQMERAISKSDRFTLASEAGADVISVSAILTEIAPTAPKDDMSSRPAGRSTVYTDSAGSISIAMALGDGVSGEVLALIKDTRSSQTNNWRQNNRVTNMAEVRRIFGEWGDRLTAGLEQLDRVNATK